MGRACVSFVICVFGDWRTMYCGNCGTRLPEWAHFCEKCGSRVPAVPSEDPIERLDPDSSFVEPLWADDYAAQEVAQGDVPARSMTDEMTVAMDVASTVAEANATKPISMVEVVGSQGEGPAEADDAAAQGAPGVGDTPVTEDEPESVVGEPDANVSSEPDKAGATASTDEGEQVFGKEPSDKTQLMSEEDLAEAGQDDSGPKLLDDAEVPEAVEQGEAGHTDAREHEEEAPAVESTEDEAPEGNHEGSVPEFLSARRQASDAGDEQEAWMGEDEIEGRYILDPWVGRRRASERERSRVPMTLVAGVVCGAMVVVLILGYGLLFGGRGGAGQQEDGSVVVSKAVSKDEADRVISSLNGWWKTGRTFDGRYWRLQDGLMEVYAADGKIASQVLVDAGSVEHMSSGPGEIEGSGYYLRDIAFYLLDDDPDTLHSIDADGTADQDANLLRSDVPPFMGSGDQQTTSPEAQAQEPGDASEYILPESSTRAYEAWELEGLSDHDLFIARNGIYARHGYVFEGGELSEYFASKSWYLASDVFNEADITEIERQNVSTILSIEQQRGSTYV